MGSLPFLVELQQLVKRLKLLVLKDFLTNIREHLPDGFSVQEAHYESKDGIRWVHPVIIKDNQKFEIKIYNNRGEPLDKMPTGADVRRAMLNFYQGDIERYNITRPTPPQ